MLSVIISNVLAHVEISFDDDRIWKVMFEPVKNCVTTIAGYAFWAKFLIMNVFIGCSYGGANITA